MDDIRAWVTSRLPAHANEPITLLGEGLDNIAYDADDAIVVRKRKDGDGDAAY